MVTEEAVRQALASVKYPGYSRDIISFGLVKEIQINGADVTVKIQIATRDPALPQQIHTDATAALGKVPGIQSAEIDIDIQEPAAASSGAGAVGKSVIPGVKNIIAVASGKGGVGKSTVSANLAVALASSGASVGLCDCDLYGPSMALMFGTDERPLATEDNEIIPIVRHGVKLISMGLLLSDASPVIVRGPMATRYTQQFLQQVLWGDLDYLILDLPPGTGDIQLTIVQTVTVTGAVVVTTPQEVALIDARKAVSMFAKVNVPILGIVENMSYFRCPDTDKRYDIFGSGGGQQEADRIGVPLLGQIPIDIATREGGDNGTPIALQSVETNEISASFASIADKVKAAVSTPTS
ncbi:MAG: ATP-binding protein involved in chromosome partitioning [Verrucomicrobiales bacterium]|jgi:ATP-binding protein involved in chromosome partitioning